MVTLPERRYHAFKVSTDGRAIKRAHVSHLTFGECHNGDRFPFGRLVDDDGPYIWSHALMPEYVDWRN